VSALAWGAIPVRGPGWGWLPVVLRSRAYWREVGRFALWGPLIGGLPYALFIVTIPFVYAIGLVPAVLAGLLFAAWAARPNLALPPWPWRMAVGAMSGLAAALVVQLFMLAHATHANRAGFAAFGIVALHGVPAAVVLALSYRPRRTRP
jgi:hypothetical protein